MTTFGKHAETPQVIGPSFIALQVRHLEVSKKFYLEQIGLTASTHMPPGAVIFETKPIPFAIRTPMVDLDATSKLGWGVSLWIAATDAELDGDIAVVVFPVNERGTGAERNLGELCQRHLRAIWSRD